MDIKKQKILFWKWEILCILIALTLGRVSCSIAYHFFLKYLNLDVDDLFLLVGVSFFASLVFVRKKLNFEAFCHWWLKFTDKVQCRD
jgi:hypothetical protein